MVISIGHGYLQTRTMPLSRLAKMAGARQGHEYEVLFA
jgi:hypothetical protein